MKAEGSGHVVLKPLADAGQYKPRVRQLVYVPVYSSIYWGFDGNLTDLGITLSIRNVSPRHTLVLHAAKYYDTDGKAVRDYVPAPSTLGPLGTAEFVIQRKDTTGGTGANFLVEWSSAEDMDEPVIEAIMMGQQGNAGVSFTSQGRALPKASAELAR